VPIDVETGTSTARMAVLLDASTPGGQTVPFGMVRHCIALS